MNLFHHSVQFYDTDPELAGCASSFVAAGLQAQASVILITTSKHQNDIRNLPAPPSPVCDEMPIYLDAAAALSQFMIDDWPSDFRFFRLIEDVIRASSHTRPVWIFGEMVGALCAEGKYRPAVRLEELWNQLATRLSFSLLCAYPINSFVTGNHTESFLQVCRRHNHVLNTHPPSAVG